MAVVETEINDHVAVVTLNRPDARNALDPELIVGLAGTWETLAEDTAVRSIVVTGAEGTTFCSGFDLGTTIPIMTGARQPDNEFEQAVADDLGLLGRATLRDYDPGKPMVAAVNGHAIAGGMELMLACDLRVVASGVRLGLSEVARAGDSFVVAPDEKTANKVADTRGHWQRQAATVLTIEA